MMMQGQEPVEKADLEWAAFGQKQAHGFAGRQDADSSSTLRKGYKPAARQSPSTPHQKEPATPSRLSGMLQARRGFANL